MEYTQDEALQLLYTVIEEEERHPHYKRVTTLADDYKAYVTGDGLDDKLEQFVKRENEDEFEQRKLMTKHIIPAVVSRLTAPERKVPRSNGKIRVLSYKDDNKEMEKKINEILDKFWGDKSFDNWMETRWLELNDIDPNTFVVFEWKPFESDKEHLQPYPYEVDAHQAVMFEYDNNILQYLVDYRKIEDKIGGKKVELSSFTYYGKNWTIKLMETKDEKIEAIAKDEKVLSKGRIGGKDILCVLIKSKVYVVSLPKPHDSDMVPAMRIGYKRDELTKGLTFVSPYHDAVPYLEKTIKTNSELDLTMALHAFPQKIIARRPCHNKDCRGGYITDEDGQKRKCPQCKGTGLEVHSSAQDVITVKMPDDPEEQIQLDNLVHYISPEVALLEFQDTFIDKLTERCQEAMYNSETFDKTQVAQTATEKTISLDNIYDTLFPLSVKYAKDWVFGVKLIAKLTDLDKDLVAVMTFSKDFKFKSKDNLINERKQALDSKAPDEVTRDIDDDIMRISTADNPYEFMKYKTKQEFDPFSGKSEEDKAAIKASGLVPKKVLVLDDNYGWIFDELELEHEGFYQFPKKKKKELLNKKVEEIMKEMEAESTTPDLMGEIKKGEEGKGDLLAEA